MRGFASVLTGVVLVVFARAVAGQPVTLDDVLRRAGQYLIGYEERLATVVAEESYAQWIEVLSSRSVSTRRTLTSDFLLMRIPGPGGGAWLGFRDVLLVNGQPVRDREQRLLAPLLSGSTDALDQLERIGQENARYNLGNVYRTINVPTLALEYLHPEHRSRSSFRKIGEATIDGVGTWRLDYKEQTRPSMIRGTSGRDRLGRGTLWVDPLEGTVLQTELEVGGDDAMDMLRSRITVEYRLDAGLGVRVPSRMREVYEQRTRRILGLATYANFRRFETTARILAPQEDGRD